MLIVCAGMLRAGSTWQYQVACDLLRRAGRTVHALGFYHTERLAAFLAQPRDPAADYVYKTHLPDPLHRTLDPAGVRTLYCFRDLRDVVDSMTHKLSAGFWPVVREHRVVEQCLAGDAFWKAMPGVFVQKYEEWVNDNRPFVDRIAAYLGLTLSAADLAAVTHAGGFEQNRERMRAIAALRSAAGDDLLEKPDSLWFDQQSLFHWNHLRTGEVGQWRRTARPEERAYLAAICGDWLVRHGYEADRGWAA